LRCLRGGGGEKKEKGRVRKGTQGVSLTIGEGTKSVIADPYNFLSKLLARKGRNK